MGKVTFEISEAFCAEKKSRNSQKKNETDNK